MKKLQGLLIVLMLSMLASGQKVYFIYLQTDDQRPFFIRMNEKVYSSAESGYLVLSNLRDSTYNIHLGFPGGQSADHRFQLTVDKKDYGYLIKNLADGPALFDLQSIALVKPAENKESGIVKTEKRETNAFTDLLAKAADDSTLKEKQILIKQEEIIPEQKQETKPDTATAIEIEKNKEKKEDITTEPVQPEAKKTEPVKEITPQPDIKSAEVYPDTISEKEEVTTAVPEAEYQQSIVTLRSESSTTEGFGIVFLDQSANGKTDTIRILIPADKKIILAEVEKEEPRQEEKKFIEIIPTDTVAKKIEIETPVEKNETEEPRTVKAQPVYNPGCKAVALEDDLYSIRRKMAAGKNDDDMISEARKVFKNMCVTVQQIKHLSTLFLTDEGKYKFFDAAYPNAFDPGNFGSLQSELKEEYYINRFKAMLR